jgi:hypothetical protein
MSYIFHWLRNLVCSLSFKGEDKEIKSKEIKEAENKEKVAKLLRETKEEHIKKIDLDKDVSYITLIRTENMDEFAKLIKNVQLTNCQIYRYKTLYILQGQGRKIKEILDNEFVIHCESNML